MLFYPDLAGWVIGEPLHVGAREHVRGGRLGGLAITDPFGFLAEQSECEW